MLQKEAAGIDVCGELLYFHGVTVICSILSMHLSSPSDMPKMTYLFRDRTTVLTLDEVLFSLATWIPHIKNKTNNPKVLLYKWTEAFSKGICVHSKISEILLLTHNEGVRTKSINSLYFGITSTKCPIFSYFILIRNSEQQSICVCL